MKILFYTEDESAQSVAGEFSARETLVTVDQDQLLKAIDEVADGEHVLLLLDFDYQTKKTMKLNDKLAENSKVTRFVFSGSVKDRVIKKHKDSDKAANGYLTKPLEKGIIDDLLKNIATEDTKMEKTVVLNNSDVSEDTDQVELTLEEATQQIGLMEVDEGSFDDFDLGVNVDEDEDGVSNEEESVQPELELSPEDELPPIELETSEASEVSKVSEAGETSGNAVLPDEDDLALPEITAEKKTPKVDVTPSVSEAKKEAESDEGADILEFSVSKKIEDIGEIKGNDFDESELTEEEGAEEYVSATESDEDVGDLEPTVEDEVLVRSNDELVRMQATINQLRVERERMLADLKKIQLENGELERSSLGQRAELDDLRIEIKMAKKRHMEEMDQLKVSLRTAGERRDIAEEKAKQLQREFDHLEDKVNVDIHQIKHREQDLESKLEFMAMDKEAQLASRDKKILDLKRKIDHLEFNIETTSMREKKSKYDKQVLEDRLGKIMRTLRGSIELLDGDISPPDLPAAVEKLKKVS